MDPNNKQQNEAINAADAPENPDRRELVVKLGKFAAYAAPFTVLALTPQKAKASAGSGAVGHGGGKHP